jgi:hypothetical protein
MRIRASRRWGIASIGLASLALFWSHTAQAQVKLQYKFLEGKTLKYKETTKTHQVLTLAGQEIENVEDTTSITSSTVGKRRDDSTVPVEQKVESFRIELTLPGGTNVTYDSSDPKATIDNPQLAFLNELFKLAGETIYTVVLDDQNKVKAIEGAEKLLEKADKLSPEARDLIRSHLEADKLRKEFEQELGHLPDVLARPGESWVRTEIVEIGNGQSLTLEKKYEYVGTEKVGDRTLDKISSKATKVEMKQDPAVNAQLKVLKNDVKLESFDETILFDREHGYEVRAQRKLRVKGDHLTYQINGMELAGTMDLTVETKRELEPGAK